MSLKAKINAAVDRAFTAIGDLAVSATISNKTVGSYNFATGETVGTTSSKTVKVFIQSTNKPSDGAFQSTALMKSNMSVDGYDTLTVGTTVYNITDHTDDGFVITLSLTREKV
jgi:hypothetical protein